jgi:hypothetical protein
MRPSESTFIHDLYRIPGRLGAVRSRPFRSPESGSGKITGEMTMKQWEHIATELVHVTLAPGRLQAGNRTIERGDGGGIGWSLSSLWIFEPGVKKDWRRLGEGGRP